MTADAHGRAPGLAQRSATSPGPVGPTFWAVARRPRWLAALILTLLVAAAFAALGRWQVESAVRSSQRDAPRPGMEQAVPLASVLEPQRPLMERAVGATVAFRGVLDERDADAVDGRTQAGRAGAWLIARVHVVDAGSGSRPLEAAPSLAVAVAWFPSLAEADAAAGAARQRAAPPTLDRASDFNGFLEFAGAPTKPRGDGARELTQVSPAHLVNRWQPPIPSAYNAYVILEQGRPDRGGEPIRRQVAGDSAELNWLNIFYAIEWAIFAGFALYFWWELVRKARDEEWAALAEGSRPEDDLEAQVRREHLRRIRDAYRETHDAGAASGDS